MDNDVHKTINFSQDLVPLVLSGEKTVTWRLWDEKNLSEGDIVAFMCRPNITPFATGRITSAIEKTMAELTEEDKEGHESFPSDEKMYEVYSRYYKRSVGPDTPVKVIHFQVLKKNTLEVTPKDQSLKS